MTTNPYIAKVSEDLRGASATELAEVQRFVSTLLKSKNNVEMWSWRRGQTVLVSIKGLTCKAKILDIKRVWIHVELVEPNMVLATGFKLWRVKPSSLKRVEGE